LQRGGQHQPGTGAELLPNSWTDFRLV
jgi:hypothetical protein